jgi:hypothetical protein
LRAERYIITAKIIALEVFEAAKALKEKSSKLLSKARDHINKPEVIDIKPRIRSRDLELEEAFEKFGRKYFDMPTVSTDNKSATLKINAPETASKPAYVPSWKRRSRPDDDPSP